MASSRMRRSAEGIVARLEGVVARCLEVELPDRRQVTVALSGGIDSIVLLDVVRAIAPRLGVRLDALHIDHGLSPNASRWERFCRLHCARRLIPFASVRVAVAGEGANIEAHARAARYAAFARHPSGAVLLAHNQDDQAETVLLQLVRGAGVRGLGAMPVSRRLRLAEAGAAQPLLLRPLLGISRREIERYAARKRLSWVEDETNRDERFARNFVRARVLPLLEQRFPGCRAAIARSGAHLADAARLLERLADIDAAGAIEADRLSVARLRALGSDRAANVLRMFLRCRGVPPPSSALLRATLAQLCSARSDAKPQIRLGAYVLRRFRDRIELCRDPAVDERAAVLPWTGQPRMVLGGTSALHVRSARGRGVSRAKLAGGTVTVRLRQGGERMQLDPRRPRRTLKNLLQEAGVPPWARASMPLVFRDEELVWAPGIGVACRFRAQRSEPSLLFSWTTSAPTAGVDVK